MDIVISNTSDIPIYRQIYEQIVAAILDGELEAHTCLPSIRNVARELGVSIITVKGAWEKLESEGFIYTQAGKGCFVSQHSKKTLETKKLQLAKERLKSDIEYYKTLGLSESELIKLIKDEL